MIGWENSDRAKTRACVRVGYGRVWISSINPTTALELRCSMTNLSISSQWSAVSIQQSSVLPFMALARTSGSWSWMSRRAAGKISLATSSGVNTSAYAPKSLEIARGDGVIEQRIIDNIMRK